MHQTDNLKVVGSSPSQARVSKIDSIIYKEKEINKERLKQKLKSKTIGALVKVKGRIKGMIRKRELTTMKGILRTKLGKERKERKNIVVNTKWGTINITLLRNTEE